jgi:hypothetical protein
MTKKFDPVHYHEMSGSGRGRMILDMKECANGDYVKVEDHERIVNSLKEEVLQFLENVLTGGWQYIENGDMFTDATELKNKLQS